MIRTELLKCVNDGFTVPSTYISQQSYRINIEHKKESNLKTKRLFKCFRGRFFFFLAPAVFEL